MKRLDGKVALITGAAVGIGKGIAEMFGKEGADVCIADIDIKGAEACASKIQEFGCKSLAVEVDISNIHDIDRMVDSTIDYFGRIDILVNNAGVLFLAPLLEVSEEQWDRLMDVNLKGVFFATQRVAHHMIKQNSGKIINLASNMGAVGDAAAIAYAASKGGVINLTRALALSLAPNHINVNAIGPAFVDTPMNEAFMADEELTKGMLQRIPIGRFARPEDIAGAAVYLASSESDFVTGETLFVDGGFLCQ